MEFIAIPVSSILCFSAVTSVTIVDDWPTGKFEKVEGEFKLQYNEIAVSESVSFKIVLVPKFDGNFYVPPAAVQYLPSPDAQNQVLLFIDTVFDASRLLDRFLVWLWN